MRRRNLTMGEISEYMAQEYGTANFARKSGKRRGKSRKTLLGSTLSGRLVRAGAAAGVAGLVGTKGGRGLIAKGYNATTSGAKTAYRKTTAAARDYSGRAKRAYGLAAGEMRTQRLYGPGY